MDDREIMGGKTEMSHEEVERIAQLTPEEKQIEKKLRRLIDMLIMPFVILVYLMNYIDRYGSRLSSARRMIAGPVANPWLQE